ncbi:MAG: dihydroxyacetone kinase subunit DhaK [Acidimicrobiales bacterium]|jgi:dihydroxyacetone kinase
MRKIMNDPKNFVDDFLDGLLKAYPREFCAVPGFPRALRRVEPSGADPKVAIVTGGGSGHLPLFLGYVGQGLCSAVAVGNTFSSPSADAILAATKASQSGKGVLFLYGNYSGDGINFDDAADMASDSGIETETVRAADDVASAPPAASGSRRGVAGLTLAYKCAGAAAAANYTLSDTAKVAARSLANTRTMGVGLSPTIIPEAGRPTFELAEGEMELGIGIHGEPGIRREEMGDADGIADVLLDGILAELGLTASSRVAVLVNSLGATPEEELYIVYGRVADRLAAMGVTVHRTFVGRYATSLEMAGCSISVMTLDDELTSLLDAHSYSPLLRLF